MKNPAFLFYSSDFLSGCSDLTMQERGQYITLLCLQHQKGHLADKVVQLNLGCFFSELSPDLQKKFQRDENGCFFNVRCETESARRETFIEKQLVNAKKGGAPKGNANAQKQPKNNPKTTQTTTQKQPIVENENENRNENRNENEGKGVKGGKAQKKFFSEFVSMTNVEYQTLVAEYGEYATGEFIRILDNYKGANGKKYQSDYRAILNWVVDRFLEKNSKNNGAHTVTVTAENLSAVGRGYQSYGKNSHRADAQQRKDECQMLAEVATRVLRSDEA
jgi:uncharacterized protein YdaU (DUF1376 family)